MFDLEWMYLEACMYQYDLMHLCHSPRFLGKLALGVDDANENR